MSMTRAEFNKQYGNDHDDILIDQFGFETFTIEERAFLTKIRRGRKDFIKVLDILEEAGVISSDNLFMTLVRPNLSYYGRCDTVENSERTGYLHHIRLNHRALATFLHEIAHVVCFDEGFYEDYMDDLSDETAHGKDFDRVMKMLINLVLERRRN